MPGAVDIIIVISVIVAAVFALKKVFVGKGCAGCSGSGSCSGSCCSSADKMVEDMQDALKEQK